MAMAIHLYFPKEEDDEEVIENYYEYLIENHKEVAPDDFDVSEYESTREMYMEMYREKGWVDIYQRGWSGYKATEAGEEFWEIMKSEGEENYQTKPITDEETLRTLVDLLRGIKEELQEMGGGPERSDGLEFTPEDREIEFECWRIPLFEFAIEEGYGILMDY